MRITIASITACVLAVSLIQAQPTTRPAGLQARTETLDARTAQGTLVSLSESQATLETEGGSLKKIPLADLAEIACAPAGDPMIAPGRAVVAASAGGNVTASGLTVADGKLNFTNSSLGKLTLPFSRVASIYLPSSTQTAADVVKKCAAMELERGDTDLVVVARKTGGWLGVQGILKSIDATTLTFTWKGTDRKISMVTVRAIFLASTGTPAAEKFKGVLTLRDGSAVRFNSVTFAGGAFTVGPVGSPTASLAAESVSKLKFSSDRVLNLSEVKPLSVKQHGLLNTVMGWRVNESVSGGSISLGGRVFNSGVAMHSFCELTYGLDAQYTGLIAIVGIDDAVRPGGDANLTFIGDGKEILAPLRVTGKGKPQAVRVPLKGIKTFVIRVDYGKDMLDVSDHVDLAGARLIK